MDLSVSSSSWGLGRAAVCDCGTPWTFNNFFAISAAIFIIILLLIISGPEALLGSKFTMTSLISSSVISILSNTLSVCSENGGKVACESSSEGTEAKYEFKQLAFSKSETC